METWDESVPAEDTQSETRYRFLADTDLNLKDGPLNLSDGRRICNFLAFHIYALLVSSVVLASASHMHGTRVSRKWTQTFVSRSPHATEFSDTASTHSLWHNLPLPTRRFRNVPWIYKKEATKSQVGRLWSKKVSFLTPILINEEHLTSRYSRCYIHATFRPTRSPAPGLNLDLFTRGGQEEILSRKWSFSSPSH